MAKFKSLLLEDYEYGDVDVPEKYDDLDFEPPSAAQQNAQQVIDWKDEHGRDEVAGMTQTGWQRANQLADGVEVSPDVISKMASFARHEDNKEVADEYEDEPWKDKGHVAWLGWGGDEGVEWAQEMQDKMDKIDQQNEMKLTQDKLRSIIREELMKEAASSSKIAQLLEGSYIENATVEPGGRVVLETRSGVTVKFNVDSVSKRAVSISELDPIFGGSVVENAEGGGDELYVSLNNGYSFTIYMQNPANYYIYNR